MRKAFVFDLDGTLALMHGRRSPYNLKEVRDDDVNAPVLACLRALHDAGFAILIFSGRDAVCRAETEMWLAWHEVPHDALIMRPRGNVENDAAVKRRMLDGIGDYQIVGAFEDRKRVKRMWVGRGVFVFDVNQDDREF